MYIDVGRCEMAPAVVGAVFFQKKTHRSLVQQKIWRSMTDHFSQAVGGGLDAYVFVIST